jgi:uncharacterized protein YukJ
MNKRVKELAEQASILSRQEHPKLAEAVTLNDILGRTDRRVYVVDDATTRKFAEMIVSAVLDEVNERVYYSGDRAWSDELDRKWIELEFGFGELADKQNERTN